MPRATVRQVLSHQGGVMALDRPAPAGAFSERTEKAVLT